MILANDSSHLPFLATEATLAEFIENFEQGTLPRAMWTHTAHLTVAAWYLLALPEPEAIERVRAGIRHYNSAAGIPNTADSGYHETLTLFWLGILADFLHPCDGPAEKVAAIRLAVNEFGAQRALYRQYYSFDVVGSREARAQWIPPDLAKNFRGNKTTLGDI